MKNQTESAPAAQRWATATEASAALRRLFETSKRDKTLVEHTHGGGRCSPLKEKRLGRLYDQLNARFFARALPRVPVLLGNSGPGKSAFKAGDYILIDWRFWRGKRLPDPETWAHMREILLHEMCHTSVRLEDDRRAGGGEWQAHTNRIFLWRLKSLADKGEEWAVIEYDGFRSDTWWDPDTFEEVHERRMRRQKRLSVRRQAALRRP